MILDLVVGVGKKEAYYNKAKKKSDSINLVKIWIFL